MKKYEVSIYDCTTGATSPIDTVVAPSGYTAEQYIADCKKYSDDAWNEMLTDGIVIIAEI